MSKITIEHIQDTNSISISSSLDNDLQFDFCWKFTENTTVRNFENLKFGLTLSTEDGYNNTCEFPRSNHTYMSTDQDYLEILNLVLLPDKIYKMFVWIEQSFQMQTQTFQFKTLLPKCPYPSWTWDGTQYIPPKPKPISGLEVMHQWDEEAKCWFTVDGVMADTSGYDVT